MLASAPAVWLLLFGLFVVRARLALDRWPAPYRPDPKDLGFDVHYAAVLVGMPLMFAAVLIVTVLTVFDVPRDRARWWIPVLGAASLAAVIALASADPGYFFTWLGD
jgi:hypothetical protein